MPHYLIQYGKPGFVGAFRSTLGLARHDRVVVKTPRGVEFGVVFVSLNDASVSDGEVLRTAEREGETDDIRPHAQELLAVASARAAELGLPLAFVDVEVTLDGTAILHALPWDACDATPLLDELTSRFTLVARLLDLSRAPGANDPSAGCGKPGCGSESGGCSSGVSGGCSSGSCSRGSVKSAEALTAYFADLRQKMEAVSLARTPLN